MPTLAETFKSESDAIQGKIDNIGEYKFRVKGWSLTLQTGIIVALLSGKVTEHIPAYMGWVMVPAAASIILLFHCLEQKQGQIENALTDRAISLERAIELLTVSRTGDVDRYESVLRGALKEVGGSPRLAVTMRSAAQRKRTFRSLARDLFGPSRWRLNMFYYVQYVVTILSLTYIFLMDHKPQEVPSKSLVEYGVFGEKNIELGSVYLSSAR